MPKLRPADLKDYAVIASEWLEEQLFKIVEYDLEINPGWTTEGQWEYGWPAGSGALEYGNPDPMGGYNGSNAYGVNLTGDYSVVVGGPYYLTADPIDCSSFRNIKLEFFRWLNTDTPEYVDSKIEVSNDGVSWDIVWQHTEDETITDSDWQIVQYDLGPVADGQSTVYIRWGYELLSDRAYSCSGWNIDEIKLWAYYLALTSAPRLGIKTINVEFTILYIPVSSQPSEKHNFFPIYNG